MKKFMLALLFAITLVGVTAAACCIAALNASASEKVVYLKRGGEGDGSSPDSPTNTLTDAYSKLGKAGGTIVVVDNFEITANFTAPSHTGEVTITQVYGGVDYRDGENKSVYVEGNGRRWIMGGPTRFENINFKGDTSATNNFILFVAQFNPIVMGEGITSIDFTGTTVAKSLTILGGCQSGSGVYKTVAKDQDPKITIESGRFVVIGFNRSINAEYTGCAHINISGGNIVNLYPGSVDSGYGGYALVNISGGTIRSINAGTSTNRTKGDVEVTIMGGDFSGCKSLAGGPKSGSSTLDISRHPDVDTLKELATGFSTVITDAGQITTVHPKDAFSYGSYTDSQGTTLPYRFYIPENYDPDKEYPVVVYLHGAGSRGSDNEIHLTTNGAALNTAIFQSEYECIMIAPQAPAGGSWYVKEEHPGTTAYVEQQNIRPEMNAAIELLYDFLDHYSVDMDRIYITGSSNGGLGTWDMIYRCEGLFAAAIPLAGAKLGDAMAEYAQRITNVDIWTFHGDADATVPVQGTRDMVAAVKAAGGSIIYTEVPGGDHNIWDEAAATEGIVDWLFAQTKRVAGDVDGDYEFTNSDVTAAIRHLSGWSEVGYDRADVDLDGKVTNRDAIMMIRALAGWDVELNIAGKGNGIEHKKSIKILAIGNSFSSDATQYLWNIFDNAGYDEVKIGNLYIGGCSLDTHWSNIQNSAEAYTYYVNASGEWSTTTESINDALVSDDWDIITVQQASAVSGVSANYTNLANVVNYVNENKPVGARLFWHMTWAYQQTSTHSGFANYSNNQMTMYSAILTTAKTVVLNTKGIDGLIPSGTAVQNMRTSYIGDTLTRDGYHMSYDYGRYLTALTWFSYVTGRSAYEITWVPEQYPYIASASEVVAEAVDNAIAVPFAVTGSSYTEAPSDDAAIFNSLKLDITQYTQLDIDMTVGAFYNSNTSHSMATTGDLALKFATTKKYTRDELPVGTVIILDSGYKYRPDAWLNESTLTSSRPSATTNQTVVVDESWWGNYTLRVFNLSRQDDGKVTTEDTVHLRIYVPN